MKEVSTRLRYVFSKDPEVLVQWVNNLPYKIEIKGPPVIQKDKFYLFFILADQSKDMFMGNLDE